MPYVNVYHRLMRISLDLGFQLPVFKTCLSFVLGRRIQIFMFCSNCVHGKLTCKSPLTWIWLWQCLGTPLQCDAAWRNCLEQQVLAQDRFCSSRFPLVRSAPLFLPFFTILPKAFLDGFLHFSWAEHIEGPSKRSLMYAWCKVGGLY